MAFIFKSKLAFDQDDSSLVELAKSGSVQGLSGLYQKYVVQVYRFFFWQVDSDADAEDLTHTVFIELAKSIRTYSGKSQFKTWLFGMCKIQLAKWWRQRKITISWDSWMDYLAQPLAGWDFQPETPESELISENQTKIKAQKIELLLSYLKPMEQKVIRAHYLQNFPFKMVAEKLTISLTNAKVIAHRAIQKLERKFNK